MILAIRRVCFEGTPEIRCAMPYSTNFGVPAREPKWSKVAQVSIFWTGGVGVFGAIGFAGIMDNIPPHLALPGVLQRGQAADCS